MRIKYLTLLLAVTMLLPTSINAREKKSKAKTEQKAKDKKSKEKKKKEQAATPKDSVKVEKTSIERKGLFNVTKVKNDWFFEIPDNLIGREFLTTTRYKCY